MIKCTTLLPKECTHPPSASASSSSDPDILGGGGTKKLKVVFRVRATLGNVYPHPHPSEKIEIGFQVSTTFGRSRSRSGQGARMNGSDFTMIQVDLIQMDDCSPTAVP